MLYCSFPLIIFQQCNKKPITNESSISYFIAKSKQHPLSLKLSWIAKTWHLTFQLTSFIATQPVFLLLNRALKLSWVLLIHQVRSSQVRTSLVTCLCFSSFLFTQISIMQNMTIKNKSLAQICMKTFLFFFLMFINLYLGL